MSTVSTVTDYYSIQNTDENGEYRANKYNRKLGLGYSNNTLPLVTKLDPSTASLAEILKVLERDGAVVLKNALPVAQVAKFAQEHQKVLNRKDISEMMQQQLQERKDDLTQNNSAKSFYKGERTTSDGLRMRTTAFGRFDLKHLDRRDGPLKELSSAIDPLVLPDIVKTLLSHTMGTPWRVTTVGSIPTLPNAVGGDWHRDIGEGLFGEEQDVKLIPDYYFNALIPLGTIENEECGTEIVVGSHREGIADVVDRRFIASGVAGDIIFFNGKCIHRGRPNVSERQRDLIYIVYAAKWFEQGRDAVKEIGEWGSKERPVGEKEIGKLRSKL